MSIEPLEFQKPTRAGRLRHGAFVVSALIPLLGLTSKPPGTMLLIYTLYVGAYLGRDRLRAAVASLKVPRWLLFLTSFWISGTVTETLAWLNNYLARAPEPALFHPQLFADLIVGLGFYGGWAVAWRILLQRYRFTLAEAFLITGFQGIFFEQLGKIFLAMLQLLATNPVLAVIFGLYVASVHGSAVGLALAPLLEDGAQDDRSRHWTRFAVAIVLMVGLAAAGTQLVALLTLPFGGLPPRRSIVEHPFW